MASLGEWEEANEMNKDNPPDELVREVIILNQDAIKKIQEDLSKDEDDDDVEVR